MPHTPGSWWIFEHSIRADMVSIRPVDPEGNLDTIADVMLPQKPDMSHDPSDAWLIVSAPDMLEEVERLHKVVEAKNLMLEPETYMGHDIGTKPKGCRTCAVYLAASKGRLLDIRPWAG